MNDIRLETEQALIGGLLSSPKHLVDVSSTVKVDDFKCDFARRAYGAMLSTWKSGKEIDYISLVNIDSTISSYLAVSIDKAAINPTRCALDVSVAAKADRVNEGVERIAREKSITSKLDGLLSLYQQEMFVDRKNPDVKSVVKRFSETVKTNKKRGSIGVSTGFSFMDDLYIQYVPGHIWTMGAYTSVGKTAMMTQKLRNLLQSNKNPRIVIISTEMTEEQMIGRIIANFTAIPSVKILSGNLTGPEEIEVAKCEKFLATKNLTVYDDVYTLGEIETVFRKAELKGGVDIGFIDYVQNCQVPEAKSEYQEQSTLAKRIQKLAKDVRSTIVCLSQVSNDVGRGNTNNLELKGAGEWAAVSDVGVMLYRCKENKYMIKYSIKKNRHGQLHDESFLYTNNWTRLDAQGKTEE
jgi:replicative DNA helicase